MREKRKTPKLRRCDELVDAQAAEQIATSTAWKRIFFELIVCPDGFVLLGYIQALSSNKTPAPMLTPAPVDPTANPTAPVVVCANAGATACCHCGAVLMQPAANFCSACGQEARIRPPLMREFLQQFGGAYVSTEGAFWRTLKLLVTKPCELTAQYLAGRRKHYVLPLRLYLTIAFLMAAVVRLGGVSMNEVDARINEEPPDSRPESVRIDLGFGKAEVRNGVFVCQNLPQWICVRMEARLNTDNAGLSKRMHTVLDRVINNVGVIMFALLPAFAFSLMLVYRNRRLRYAEHFVFALHLHAFGALVLAVMTVKVPWVNWLGTVAVLGYALLAIKRVYGGRWWAQLLRLLALTTAHGMVAVFVAVVAVLIALLV